MIQELTNNEAFSNEYRNIAPKAGDLAAVFEKNGRNLLMRLDAEGAMSLPEAVLFADYWFDPEDTEADKKAAEKGGYGGGQKSSGKGRASRLSVFCRNNLLLQLCLHGWSRAGFFLYRNGIPALFF